ncbi:MAG: hypothetical protein ABSG64_08640 [Solirubrobacteraceae bacterium]|jgi:hypothetical protein
MKLVEDTRCGSTDAAGSAVRDAVYAAPTITSLGTLAEITLCPPGKKEGSHDHLGYLSL